MTSSFASFDSSFVEFLISSKARMILCDIDGTLMNGSIVANILTRVLNEFGLPEFDIESILGVENLFQTGAMTRRLSISPELERKITARYEKLFFSCPSEIFKDAVYEEVPDALEQLLGKGFIIGVFSLRKCPLAIHQIEQASIARFIYDESTIPNGTVLKITGSGLSSDNYLSGYEDKLFQLGLHLQDISWVSPQETVIVGDSQETDIMAADTLGLKSILIRR
jgi:phosphoglycolate phosphatase-like HAD superfamily hydrolase